MWSRNILTAAVLLLVAFQVTAADHHVFEWLDPAVTLRAVLYDKTEQNPLIVPDMNFRATERKVIFFRRMDIGGDPNNTDFHLWLATRDAPVPKDGDILMCCQWQ